MPEIETQKRKQHVFPAHFWACGTVSRSSAYSWKKSRTDCGALVLAGGFPGVFRMGEACRNLRRIVVAVFQHEAGPREKSRTMLFRGTVGKRKATGLPRCLIFLNKARWGGDGGV